MIIFIVLHLSHVSSFYTIKTYMEAVDVGKIRANFKTLNQTLQGLNPNDSSDRFQALLIAEVT